MPSGKRNFTTHEGVQYMIDKYLTTSDREELRRLNTPHTQDEFGRKLVEKLERGSGGGHWIPSKYTDDLEHNASSIIGTTREKRRLKNGKDAEVYETSGGSWVYEDGRGRLRDFGTGRYIKADIFKD